GPGEQARRQHAEVKQRIELRVEAVRREELHVLGEEVPGDERVAKTQPHINEPWQRQDDDEDQAGDESQREQTATEICGCEKREAERDSTQHKRQRALRD